MATVFLNGQYIDENNANISVLDRGMLFGDSIYEVIPIQAGEMIGFDLHIQRLNRNLSEVAMQQQYTLNKWREICNKLIENNGDLPVYIQISRGAPMHRALGSGNVSVDQTHVAFSLKSEDHFNSKNLESKVYKVITAPDIRWQRCDIKSTSMIASVMTYQTMKAEANADEVLMFNSDNHLTEGCAVNVFVVNDGKLATPALSNQLLPGITRHILIDILKKDGSIPIEERNISMDEVLKADEIILSSSTKNIGSIVEVDGKPVGAGAGKPGPVWKKCANLFDKFKLAY